MHTLRICKISVLDQRYQEEAIYTADNKDKVGNRKREGKQKY